MKKLLFSFTLFSFSLFSFAQNSYQKNFENEISKLESAKKAADFQNSREFFMKYESIISGGKETKKEDWRVYYYTALSLIRGELFSLRSNKTQVDENITLLAKKYLMQVFVKNPDNAESNILLAQIYLLNSKINNTAQNLSRANELLTKAEFQDKNNPRIDILKGEIALNSKDDKALAKNYLTSAQEKFNTYSKKSNLDPSWGKEDINYYLSMIK